MGEENYEHREQLAFSCSPVPKNRDHAGCKNLYIFSGGVGALWANGRLGALSRRCAPVSGPVAFIPLLGKRSPAPFMLELPDGTSAPSLAFDACPPFMLGLPSFRSWPASTNLFCESPAGTFLRSLAPAHPSLARSDRLQPSLRSSFSHASNVLGHTPSMPAASPRVMPPARYMPRTSR